MVEDLYTLKINFKGKRTVGKANKGINVEKLKLKREKEGGGDSPELQNPNVKPEVWTLWERERVG